jgi:hypothetical protein
LEAVLQRLLVVVLVGRVLHDNCVVSFTDFSPLLGLGFPLLWDLDYLRRRQRLGDELLQVLLQEDQLIISTTLAYWVLEHRCGY